MAQGLKVYQGRGYYPMPFRVATPEGDARRLAKDIRGLHRRGVPHHAGLCTLCAKAQAVCSAHPDCVAAGHCKYSGE